MFQMYAHGKGRQRSGCTKRLNTHNSSLEGAMKLKFVLFYSSRDALSYGILFDKSQNFQILAKNHGL